MAKRIFCILVVALTAILMPQRAVSADKIVVAYVCSWTNERLPDPSLMTHINYAFGHVNDSFDGVRIQNEPFLRRVVELKEKNSQLKVMLSIGGWTSGNFSEMAAKMKYRKSFAADCQRIVEEYGLDGIDIDWEYPTSSEAGISSSPADTKNFTLLMRDIRRAIGSDKLLTAATIADGKYIDFRKCMRYMDFVNIMAYDVANPPKHHTTLFRSALSGRITVEESVDAHIRAGVPIEKLVLGMPLYGRGDHDNKVLDQYVKTRNTDNRYFEQWDDDGKVPYLVDETGQLVWAFDNTQSLAAKCQLIIDRNMLGGMYWECTEDNAQLDGMRTIYQSLLVDVRASEASKRVAVMHNSDDPMAHTAIHAIADAAQQLGCEVSFIDATDVAGGYCGGNSRASDVRGLENSFDKYHIVVADYNSMMCLSNAHRTMVEQYLDEARGSMIIVSDDTASDVVASWKWLDYMLTGKAKVSAVYYNINHERQQADGLSEAAVLAMLRHCLHM